MKPGLIPCAPITTDNGLIDMKLGPYPTCAEAHDPVIYRPNGACLWFASPTAPRALGRGLADQDPSFAVTATTTRPIRMSALAITACAVFW
jgi:hypothetical protein